MILAGRVEDEQTGEGITDVNIQIATREGKPLSSKVWRTDNDGYFSVDEPITVQPSLLLSRAAYQTTIVNPEDFYNGLHIQLMRTGELNEVVVTATTRKKANWFEWLTIAGIAGKIIYDRSR